MKWTEIGETGSLNPDTYAYTIKGCGTVLRVLGQDCEALVYIPSSKIKGNEIVRVGSDIDWN